MLGLLSLLLVGAFGVDERASWYSEGSAYVAVSNETVHWGYFSKLLEPVVTIKSGEEVTLEMATHQACDDYDLMIKGDAGMESLYNWNRETKSEAFRGKTGAGDGVHTLTGPVYVEEAEVGDVLKIEILDLEPRPNADGKTFGSNAAGWWGFQSRVPKIDGATWKSGDFTKDMKSDEYVVIYELVEDENNMRFVQPYYSFEWPEITDPDGNTRNFIQYPGTCVPHDKHGTFTPSSFVSDSGWTKKEPITYVDDLVDVKIPVHLHVGCMGLAPGSQDFADSVPPLPTGGNVDDKRIGAGIVMYYPVEVKGGLFSAGDAHMAQGDSELDGTGVETSITGRFKLTVIKKEDLSPWQKSLNYPMGETQDHWIVHSYSEIDYLKTYPENPSLIFQHPRPLDSAMDNIFLQTRKFIMLNYDISDNEATSLISLCVDFGITQCVDGNWGMHSLIPKKVFAREEKRQDYRLVTEDLSKEATMKVIPANNETVHWGYYSKTLPPIARLQSGDSVVIEMVALNAGEDYDRMIKGDLGMESIYFWNKDHKAVPYRGATGGGDGAHIMTGPVYIEDAEPGDVLAVEILDLQPRLNPEGKTFGSNPAGNWGFQARVPKADGEHYDVGSLNGQEKTDEIVTIYELLTDEDTGEHFAVPKYQYDWPTITDPDGVSRNCMNYPGMLIPHSKHGSTVPSSAVKDMGWTTKEPISYVDDLFPAKVPVQLHVGSMGLAPSSHDFVESVPPMPTGGNVDNRRIGKGMTMHYTVEVAGALFSAGDTHSAQGDSELSGTGIETSLTGKFKFTLHKKKDLNKWQQVLDFPLGETKTHFIVHSFTEIDYLDTYFHNPRDMYKATSLLDPAMRNCFTQTRKFLMAAYSLTEQEATTIITTGVDFQITQVVDGNFGIHSYIDKSIFNNLNKTSSVTCPRECLHLKKKHKRKLNFGYPIDCRGCGFQEE